MKRISREYKLTASGGQSGSLISKARAGDMEEIRSVINRSNSETFKSVIPPEYFQDPVLSSEGIRDDFERMSFYAYKRSDKIVGVAALQIRNENTGKIRWVYILPEHCRKGIGTALMAHLESEAGRLGIKRLTLLTADKATWAIRFYTKLGYRGIGMIKRLWGFDLLMIKDLKPT